MKKFIKILFAVVLGILCVACGGSKTQYDLEGKYSLKRTEYNEDGTEILKLNANVEITKKGDLYTIVGKQTELEKDYEKNIFTKKITYGTWEEKLNDNFTFTGKLIDENIGVPDDEPHLKASKLYVYNLKDENNNTITIMVYKDSKVKEAIKNLKAQYNSLKYSIYDGKDINDVINLNSNNKTLIKYNLTAIKEN